MIICKILIAVSLCLPLVSNAQDHNVPVYSDTRFQLDFPWAGGMNSCQFGKIDLDFNGIKDMVVFDRTGNRIVPFLVKTEGSSFDYHYAPEYAAKFPALAQWVIFADFNLDGKEDIFTYSPGYAGLKVYRNSSSTELDFRLEVFPYLTSFQGGGYVNILMTYADYPAITDLDGDGDLDILTFWGLGSFVEKHVNMSMEKYGHADSLDFIKTESCWGYFAESEEGNLISLDTCLRCMEAWRQGGMEALIADRHTGSTFCVLDLNGDNLLDLLLGDVDYPNLIALYNGGTKDTARMTSYDWQYPQGEQAINLFSMPAAFYDDFNFDGVKDLLVSPFDPNPFNPENFQSTWLYQNNGSTDQPQFNRVTESFLQDRMLDFGAGAYPVIFDAGNDGILDIIAGNYGYYDTSYFDQNNILHTDHTGKLAYLENSGTSTQPAFVFAERDFAGISSLNIKGAMPAFGDLDGDGDADMLLGSETGQLVFFENIANPGEAAVFSLVQENYQGIDVGSFSTPQLFDLDRDNLSDLVIGEKGGNLNWYRNSGTLTNPDFSLVTDSLGKINVTDPNVSLDGYSVPCFYRSVSGISHLVVGSEQGVVFYFTGIDNNLYGKFNRSDTLAGLIGLQELKTGFGYRSAPALADFDQDGIPELVAGNFSGGIEYFGIHDGTPVSGVKDDDKAVGQGIEIYPNPATNIIYIDIPQNWHSKPASLAMINSTGKEVFFYYGFIPSDFNINSSSFPVGIYILRIILKNEQGGPDAFYTRKIILMN